jgi:hypothetical protein
MEAGTLSTRISNLLHLRGAALAAIFAASTVLAGGVQALAPAPVAAFNEEKCPADSVDPDCKDQRSPGDQDPSLGDRDSGSGDRSRSDGGKDCVIVWLGIKPVCVQDAAEEATILPSDAHPKGGSWLSDEGAATQVRNIDLWLQRLRGVPGRYSADQCHQILWEGLDDWNNRSTGIENLREYETMEKQYLGRLGAEVNVNFRNGRRAEVLRQTLQRIRRGVANQQAIVGILNVYSIVLHHNYDGLGCKPPEGTRWSWDDSRDLLTP